MDATFEQQVRERAYGLWIESGRVHGMAHEHWCIAEAAMRHEHADVAPPVHVSSGCDIAALAIPEGEAKAASKSRLTETVAKASPPKPETTKASKSSAAKPSSSKSSAAKSSAAFNSSAPKSSSMKSSSMKSSSTKSAMSKSASKVTLTDAKPTASQMVN